MWRPLRCSPRRFGRAFLASPGLAYLVLGAGQQAGRAAQVASPTAPLSLNVGRNR